MKKHCQEQRWSNKKKAFAICHFPMLKKVNRTEYFWLVEVQPTKMPKQIYEHEALFLHMNATKQSSKKKKIIL